MIASHTYHTFQSWKHLLITWAVHGNEHCGPSAIHKIINEIKQWDLLLLQWSVTFIPICNPEWYKHNKRFIDQNLARIFDVYEYPENNEQYCATMIAPYLDTCDVLLDVHSGNAENTIFVFQDIDNEVTKELTNNLWFNLVVHGRTNMYPNDWAKDPSSYMHSQWKTAVVVECGQHNDPGSEEIAYNSIKNFLYYYGMIADCWKKADIINHVIMKELFYMDRNKHWIFVKKRKNGDPIQKWEIIAIYDDWKKIFSDIEWCIILPKHYAKSWEEWFYLAEIYNNLPTS